MTFIYSWIARLLLFSAGAALMPLADAALLPTGSEWKYFKGRTNPSSAADAWRQRVFPDTAWAQGRAPFSYGEPGFVGTDLSDMQGSYTTVFLRKTFTVVNPASVESLQFHAFFDDGFQLGFGGHPAFNLVFRLGHDGRVYVTADRRRC